MKQLKEWIGIDIDPSHNKRCFAWGELLQLSQSELFEFGSHLDDHISLSSLIPDEKLH